MYLQDPITKEYSVSLTMLVASFALLVVAGGLEMAEVVEDATIYLNLFSTSCILYFSRKTNVHKFFDKKGEKNATS